MVIERKDKKHNSKSYFIIKIIQSIHLEMSSKGATLVARNYSCGSFLRRVSSGKHNSSSRQKHCYSTSSQASNLLSLTNEEELVDVVAMNASKTQRVIKATNSPVSITVHQTPQTMIRDFSSVASLQSSSFDTPSDKGAVGESSRSNGHYSSSNIRPFNPETSTPDQSEEEKMESPPPDLIEIASQPCTPLSLSDMYKYASGNIKSKNYLPQRLRNAQFLHSELPIRIAQRTVDLLTLPHGLNQTAQVKQIADIYVSYLREFQNFPCPTTEEEEMAFTDMLRPMVLDRASIPVAIARGLASLKDHRREELDLARLEEMEKALYRFFNARTGLRLLTEHHILSCLKNRIEDENLRKMQCSIGSIPESEAYFGCIKRNCDAAVEARKVADLIMTHCQECYGISPDIEVVDSTPKQFSNSEFTYVPTHLQYMLAELLKNSCRATVRR